MTVLQWCQIAGTVSDAKQRCARPRAVRQQAVATMLQIAVGAPTRQQSAPESFIRELTGHVKLGSQPDNEDGGSDEELAETLARSLRGLREALAPTRDPRVRHQLTKHELTQEDADRVLFPLAIYFDQLIAARADAKLAPRASVALLDPPALVQDTLFHIDDGGERFYVALEEALNEREPPPLLLEVYFYCLKDGFLGRYNTDSPERLKLMERLAQRLDREPLPRVSAAPAVPASSSRAAFPLRYYLRAAAYVSSVFAVLFVASQLEVWMVRANLHTRETAVADGIGPLDDVRPLRDVQRTLTPCTETDSDAD